MSLLATSGAKLGLMKLASLGEEATTTTTPKSSRLGDVNTYLGNLMLGADDFEIIPVNITNKVVLDTLVFTQEATREVTYNRTTQNFIGFVSQANAIRAKIANTSNTLVFTQSAKKVVDVFGVNSLTLVQDYDIERFINQNVMQTLILQQTAQRVMDYNRTINHTLNLVQQEDHLRIVIRDIEHTLTLTQVAKRVRDASTDNTLTMVSDGTGNKITYRSAKNTLVFNQTATKTQVHIRNVNQKLMLGNQKKFNPLDGSEVEVPQATYILGGKLDKTMSFTYNDKTVILDNPLFGDSQGSDYEITVKRSMNNVVRTFVKRNEVTRIRYEFEIGRAKAIELASFLKESAGKFVYMRNWKHELWYGYITSSPPAFTMVSLYHNEGEKVEITIEFTGFKL